MINFQKGDINYLLRNKTTLKKWVSAIIKGRKQKEGEINFLFCSDEFLLKINQKYLNHDTFTDIITFDYCEKGKTKIINGDILISIERVKENAIKFSETTEKELHRVMIHGILHLLGYKDKKKAEKEEMRKEEEKSLKDLKKRLSV